MKIKLTDIPSIMEGPGTIMRRQVNFGEMDVTYSELPKGTDFSAALKGLPSDSCHCPHWGYIIQGVFKILYDNGAVDVLEKGEVFYLPAGHTALVEEDVKCIMFSPEKEHGEVLTHAMHNMTKARE